MPRSGRSRSRSRHRSSHRRSRSREIRRSRRDSRSPPPSRRLSPPRRRHPPSPPRTKSRNSPIPRRNWRFDSPPKEFVDPRLAKESLHSTGFSNAGEDAATGQADLANIAAAIGLDANATKAARELYIGNLPSGVDVIQLLDFLNAAMAALKATTMPGNPCSKAWISTDGHYAFVEFRSMEEASNGMQLNGLNCLGYSLRIGRPKTYPIELAALAPAPTVAALDSSYLAQGIAGLQCGVEAAVANGTIQTSTPHAALAAAHMAATAITTGFPFQDGNHPDRICIIGIPPTMTDEKVEELVTTFGTVKFFQLMKKEDGTSSGVCICDFDDNESQKQAIEILSQSTPYTVMKAEEAIVKGLLNDYIKKQVDTDGSRLMKPQVPTRVVLLCNLVTPVELLDDNEYDDITEDVRLECETFGKVMSLEIPRPIEPLTIGDVGYAFVEFADMEGSAKARKALSGRKFANRIVEAHYFSEVRYKNKQLTQPEPNYDRQHSSLYNRELVPPSQKQSIAIPLVSPAVLNGTENLLYQTQ